MNLYLVTGTTRGLGAALRAELAKDADNLVVCFSRALEKLTAPLNFHADFAQVASIQTAFAKCAAHLAGRQFERAVLINNAGVIDPIGAHFQIDADSMARNVQINLVAPMVLTALFTSAPWGAGSKLVVNISSGAARRAIAGWSAYCAAKAGLDMATRVAAMESPAGVSICSLAPGVIDTPMQERVRGADAADFPDVARFRAMKAEGTLREAGDVARDIAGLIKAGKLTNGGNFDLRELMA